MFWILYRVFEAQSRELRVLLNESYSIKNIFVVCLTQKWSNLFEIFTTFEFRTVKWYKTIGEHLRVATTGRRPSYQKLPEEDRC